MAKEKRKKAVRRTVKEEVVLQAEKRRFFGRKVKRLRQEGILPANIYGKKIKSLAVQVDLKSFLPVFAKVGETGVVSLKVKGEKKVRPVLIHHLQLHPVDDRPLHADFYQVDLKEKVTTEVPVELVGQSPAVEGKKGVMVQLLSEVEVEALPTNLPDKFEVNIGQLLKIGDGLRVKDLTVPEGVKVLTPAGQILVRIEAPSKEETPSKEVKEEEQTEEKPVKEPQEKASAEEKPSKQEESAEQKAGG